VSNMHTTASESKNLAPNKVDSFNLFEQFLTPPIIESIAVLIVLALIGGVR
jgi:hypothetical protein